MINKHLFAPLDRYIVSLALLAVTVHVKFTKLTPRDDSILTVTNDIREDSFNSTNELAVLYRSQKYHKS